MVVVHCRYPAYNIKAPGKLVEIPDIKEKERKRRRVRQIKKCELPLRSVDVCSGDFILILISVFRCWKCHTPVELARRRIIARSVPTLLFSFSAVGILGWVLCAPLMVVRLCIRDKPDVNDDDDWRDDLCLPCYYDVNFRYPGEK